MILKRMICWNRNTARSLRGAHPRFNRWFELTSLILALVVAMLLSYYGTGAAMAHASSSRRATHASLVTSHPPKGTVVDVPDCLQPPPQSAKDRATYTPAELAEYGLPTRDESEPFAKWAQVVRGARKRACQYTVGTQPLIVTPDVSEHNNQHWAGNYADEDTPGQTYTEADTDYYAICPSQSPPENASYNAWVGIGGVIVASNYDLVQTGTQVIQQYQPGGYYAS